jgi:aspartate kinase
MESTERDRAIVVQKYGGSSLADPAALAKVADAIVRRVEDGSRLVVVVSAMGGATDELLELAQRVSPAPKRRELDMLLSTGERVTMALLSMAIADRGVEAISFTGSQCGIITDDRHTDARIIDVRPVRVEDELRRGRVVIVAGFQGMSYRREITTLGRGGSDTTALALAAALGAQACEIYSDVPGVFSADPRAVREAHLLDRIGYGALETLARHGAKVLHADAVAWARRARIVFTSGAAGSAAAGTQVGAFERRGVVAVTASAQRAFIPGAASLTGLGAAVVHASDQGLLVSTENRGCGSEAIPCATLTAVGDQLAADAEVLSLFVATLPSPQAWWTSDFGVHARLDRGVDLTKLQQAVHRALLGAEATS